MGDELWTESLSKGVVRAARMKAKTLVVARVPDSSRKPTAECDEVKPRRA